jgi:hypothetical protein
MPKHREPTFEECLSLMRKRDPQLAEDGFHFLRPRAKEHLTELLEAFRTEEVHSIRCWLLQLIGEARSEEAFALLCEQASSSNESLRDWGVAGLELLDTKASRTFLFENGLKRDRCASRE